MWIHISTTHFNLGIRSIYREKITSVSSVWQDGWVPEILRKLYWRQNPTLPGFKKTIVKQVASHYTDWTITATQRKKEMNYIGTYNIRYNLTSSNEIIKIRSRNAPLIFQIWCFKKHCTYESKTCTFSTPKMYQSKRVIHFKKNINWGTTHIQQRWYCTLPVIIWITIISCACIHR
jgi:hypothetical protein